MATFDQALTEASLIAIPVLIFLLGIGWFKYLGAGPKGIAPVNGEPPRQPQANDPNNPTPPKNATPPKTATSTDNATPPKKSTPPDTNAGNTPGPNPSTKPAPDSSATPDPNAPPTPGPIPPSNPDPNGGSGGNGSNGGGSNGGGSNGGGSGGTGSGGGGNGRSDEVSVRIAKDVETIIQHDPDHPMAHIIKITELPGNQNTLAKSTTPETAVQADWPRQVVTPIAPEGFRQPVPDLGRGQAVPLEVPYSAFPGARALAEQQVQDRKVQAKAKQPIPVPGDETLYKRPEEILQSPKPEVLDLGIKKKKAEKVIIEGLRDIEVVSPDYVTAERLPTSPQRAVKKTVREKNATHVRNSMGEWVRIPDSAGGPAPVHIRRGSTDSLSTRIESRGETKTRRRSLSPVRSPSGKVLKLLSPEAARALFAEHGTAEDETEQPLRTKPPKAERQRSSDPLVERWDDKIYDIKDIARPRPNSPVVRRRVAVEDETVDIVLGEANKPTREVEPEAETVKLITVKDKHGKLHLVDPRDLPTSLRNAQPKVAIEEEVNAESVKPAGVKPEEDLSRDKELESISKELAKFNMEEKEAVAAPGTVADADGDDLQGQQDKAQRLRELRDQLSKIKSAHNDAPRKKLEAELAKAQQRLDQPATRSDRDVVQSEDDLGPGGQPSPRQTRAASQQRQESLVDTGFRLRRSVEIVDDSMYSPTNAEGRTNGKPYDTKDRPSRRIVERSVRGARGRPLEGHTSDYVADYETRGADRSVERTRPQGSLSSTGSRRQLDRPGYEDRDDERQSKTARSQVSRRDFADDSAAQPRLAAASARGGSTVDHLPVGAAAPAPPMDVVDSRADAHLHGMGEVGPDDSSSVTSSSQASRSTDNDARSRRGERSTAADQARPEMPTAMSNIGKRAKESVVAESNIAKGGREANVDQADVIGLRAEVQKFVTKVKRDIATGFQGDTEVHNAWLDEVLTESEQIKARLNDLPAADKAKTADCDTLLRETDALLRQQIDLCRDIQEASDAARRGKQSDLELHGPGEGSRIQVESQTKDNQTLLKRAGSVGDSDDEASDSPSPGLASSSAGKSDRASAKMKSERGRTAHSQAATKRSRADDETSRAGSNRTASSAVRDRAMPENVHHRAKGGSTRSESVSSLNIAERRVSGDTRQLARPDEDLYEDRLDPSEDTYQRQDMVSPAPSDQHHTSSGSGSKTKTTGANRPRIAAQDLADALLKARSPIETGDLYDHKYNFKLEREYAQQNTTSSKIDDRPFPAEINHLSRKASASHLRPAFSDGKSDPVASRPNISGKSEPVQGYSDNHNRPDISAISGKPEQIRLVSRDPIGLESLDRRTRDILHENETGRPSSPAFQAGYNNDNMTVKQMDPNLARIVEKDARQPVFAAPVLFAPLSPSFLATQALQDCRTTSNYYSPTSPVTNARDGIPAAPSHGYQAQRDSSPASTLDTNDPSNANTLTDTGERARRFLMFEEVWRKEEDLGIQSRNNSAGSNGKAEDWERIRQLSGPLFESEMATRRQGIENHRNRLPKKQGPRGASVDDLQHVSPKPEQPVQKPSSGRGARKDPSSDAKVEPLPYTGSERDAGYQEPVKRALHSQPSGGKDWFSRSDHISKATSDVSSTLDYATLEKKWQAYWSERSKACKHAFQKQRSPDVTKKRKMLLEDLARTNSVAGERAAARDFQALSAYFNGLPSFEAQPFKAWGHDTEALHCPNRAAWDALVGATEQNGQLSDKSRAESQAGRAEPTRPHVAKHRPKGVQEQTAPPVDGINMREVRRTEERDKPVKGEDAASATQERSGSYYGSKTGGTNGGGQHGDHEHVGRERPIYDRGTVVSPDGPDSKERDTTTSKKTGDLSEDGQRREDVEEGRSDKQARDLRRQPADESNDWDRSRVDKPGRQHQADHVEHSPVSSLSESDLHNQDSQHRRSPHDRDNTGSPGISPLGSDGRRQGGTNTSRTGNKKDSKQDRRHAQPDQARHTGSKQNSDTAVNGQQVEEKEKPTSGEGGRKGPTYPPKSTGEKDSSQTQTQLRSLFDIRHIFTEPWRYFKNAKFPSLCLITFCSLAAEGSRVIAALPNLPSSSGTSSSSFAKRAPNDELPFDIRFTQKWLGKMFGGTPAPVLVLTLLFVWVSMSILMAGLIYTIIIGRTDNKQVESKEDKERKWYNNKMNIIKRIGRWMKSCAIAAARLLLMDRYPSVKWSNIGWWTCFRLGIFALQLIASISIVRHVLAIASLVAGLETPTPSGLEIAFTIDIIEGALPTMRLFPGGTMFLVVTVLTSILIIVPVGWHSLLHPRPKNLRSRTVKETLIHIFSKFRTLIMVVLGGIVVISFVGCLYFFIDIMKYVGDIGFVKDNGYMDSVGLVGAAMIFGIFALPLAWIAMKTEDGVKALWKYRADKQAKRVAEADRAKERT